MNFSGSANIFLNFCTAVKLPEPLLSSIEPISDYLPFSVLECLLYKMLGMPFVEYNKM